MATSLPSGSRIRATAAKSRSGNTTGAVRRTLRDWVANRARWVPLAVGLMMAALFIVDTAVVLEISVAPLYGIVVLVSVFSFERRGVLMLSAGCTILTVLSYFLTPHGSPATGLINLGISLSAIAATTYLVIKIRDAEAATLEARTQLAHMGRVTTLGELTASIAHEVNQPLAAIVTNGNACSRWLAAAPPNLEEARLGLERIVRDANRASQIVAHVRGLARPGVPRREWIDLNDVVHDAVALTRSEVQQHRIALNSQLADDLPRVLGDRVQLQQVLLNLMVNAIEAMAEVHNGPRILDVDTRRTEDGVRVEVRDSGKGPDARVADRLFEAFYTTKPGGMGMGLAISRSIIESHGGRIWATADGTGTAVQFVLPVGAKAAATPLTDGPSQGPRRSPPW